MRESRAPNSLSGYAIFVLDARRLGEVDNWDRRQPRLLTHAMLAVLFCVRCCGRNWNICLIGEIPDGQEFLPSAGGSQKCSAREARTRPADYRLGEVALSLWRIRRGRAPRRKSASRRLAVRQWSNGAPGPDHAR